MLKSPADVLWVDLRAEVLRLLRAAAVAGLGWTWCTSRLAMRFRGSGQS